MACRTAFDYIPQLFSAGTSVASAPGLSQGCFAVSQQCPDFGPSGFSFGTRAGTIQPGRD